MELTDTLNILYQEIQKDSQYRTFETDVESIISIWEKNSIWPNSSYSYKIKVIQESYVSNMEV